MFHIDRIAYGSALSSMHPLEKAILAFLPLLISISTKSALLLSAVLLCSVAIALFVAKISLRDYLKILFLPLSFLFSAVLGIAFVEVSSTGATPLFSFSFSPDFAIGITEESLHKASFVFLRSITALAGLLLFMLTTPLSEMVYLLRLCRFPSVFIDLTSLTYRFLFGFADAIVSIRTAQVSRLGNNGFFTSLRSLNLLISSLFHRVLTQNTLLSHALSARGYTGELRVLSPDKEYSPGKISLIVLFWLFVSLLPEVLS